MNLTKFVNIVPRFNDDCLGFNAFPHLSLTLSLCSLNVESGKSIEKTNEKKKKKKRNYT